MDPIVEFVGLRAKMYSYITLNEAKEHMKVKGVPKEELSKCSQQDFIEVLNSGKPTTINMQSIHSYQHQLYTVQMLKKGLSCNDVKRWICEDNINTEPYRYNPLSPEEQEEADNDWPKDRDMEGYVSPEWRWRDD